MPTERSVCNFVYAGKAKNINSLSNLLLWIGEQDIGSPSIHAVHYKLHYHMQPLKQKVILIHHSYHYFTPLLAVLLDPYIVYYLI